MHSANTKKINLIYLLGAGRSGTTLLATVLGNQENFCALGEMHQFLEHLQEEKYCSCGKKLDECPFWAPILSSSALKKTPIKTLRKGTEKLEAHKNIPFLLLKNKKHLRYLKTQETIFKDIEKYNKARWYIDSSKYIARYLRLKKSNQFNLKGIYLVRDVRGVIHSFKKQVQTPKSPLAAIVYYLAINFFAEVVYRLDKNVLKIRYEDFVERPNTVLKKINHHLGEPTKMALDQNFEMPHIIGGNRMKVQKKIRIKKDIAWRNNISRPQQVLFYILSAPTMLLNKYKI